jgi:ribonucleoside-diphosphate reductase alpha chain
MYREAWERGLKTTYYLRTMNKSAIDSGNRERRAEKPQFTEAEKMACSIEAMRNGGTCEACQ